MGNRGSFTSKVGNEEKRLGTADLSPDFRFGHRAQRVVPLLAMWILCADSNSNLDKQKLIFSKSILTLNLMETQLIPLLISILPQHFNFSQHFS